MGRNITEANERVMSKDNKPPHHQIPILNKKTGKTSYSQPAPPRKPMALSDPDISNLPMKSSENQELTAAIDSMAQMSASMGFSNSQDSGDTESRVATDKIENATIEHADSVADADGDISKTRSARAKTHFETLEDFIAYGYGRRGQRISLKEKDAKRIANTLPLNDEAVARLMLLVKKDVLLAVPRQLLLVARDIDGIPRLRANIQSFVERVMLAHPIFAGEEWAATLQNQPEAPSALEAFAKLMAFASSSSEVEKVIKPGNLDELKLNATNLLAVWFAQHRGLNIEDMAALLLQSVWLPAAKKLPDDTFRLRALTELSQPAGIGVVCGRFYDRMAEAKSSNERAQCESTRLQNLLTQVRDELGIKQEKMVSLEDELLTCRQQSALALQDAEMRHKQDRTHLVHELEQLRGRLIRRLEESTDLLSVGLSALRKETPRIAVMDERAELVIDALRNELDQLRGE